MGSSASFFSKVDPCMKATVPLGTPPPPGMAATVTIRVVVSRGPRVYVSEFKLTARELTISLPVF
jgi:hypothetical protein